MLKNSPVVRDQTALFRWRLDQNINLGHALAKHGKPFKCDVMEVECIAKGTAHKKYEFAWLFKRNNIAAIGDNLASNVGRSNCL